MRIHEPKKPEKPYRNFDEYLNLHRFKDGDRELRCFKCNGAGKIYDPNNKGVYDLREEDSTVITGVGLRSNKMRNRVKCPLCNGEGVGSKDVYQLQYKGLMDRYRQDMDLYKKNKDIHNSICKKLTKEEREYLGI